MTAYIHDLLVDFGWRDAADIIIMTTVVYQVYLTAFQYLKLGYASAESVVLFVAILILTILNNRVFSRFSYSY